ncbi:hypothetical protein [Halovivax limisalsi]|uniref:hypothetical protein n=1 Tax=Halovivax limisalsi TaxID=1453760 RepID=UPI001FFDB4DA|nr:hypothetical protein [Halovivax limisalsi]
MPDDPIERVESALDRAAEVPADEAVTLLESARADLADARSRGAVDTETAADLATRLTRRIREIEERDAYDGGMGAAMEPDEEDAP